MSEAQAQTPEDKGWYSRIPFTARDEASIKALANWMAIAGSLNILAALFKMANVFLTQKNHGSIVEAVVNLLIGLWIIQASTYFRKVAVTDHADQDHLVRGFTYLRRVFLLQGILVILALAAICFALVVAVSFGMR